MRYAKTIVAAVLAAATAAQVAITDDVITAQEWLTIALAVAGVLGVWAVPNRPADTARLVSQRTGKPMP